MSLAFARALAEFLTSHGVDVTWDPGADRRGNGQTSAYQAMHVHHTAGASLDYVTNDLRAGRPGLDGPLCNSAGFDNGGLAIVSVNPANHAGASGGWDTAPLPVTSLFNRLTWGHETMYPGTRPMSPEQYRTCTILAAGVCRLTGHDYDPRWAKFHQGTSITGKWDPGYAPGKTYPVDAFRAAVLLVMKGQHMPLTQADADLVASTVWRNMQIALRGPNDEKLAAVTSPEMILARVGGGHLAAQVLNQGVETVGIDDKKNGRATSLRSVVAYSDAHIDETRRVVREQAANIIEAVRAGGVDPEAFAAAAAPTLAAAIVEHLPQQSEGITVGQVRETLVDVLTNGTHGQ